MERNAQPAGIEAVTAPRDIAPGAEARAFGLVPRWRRACAARLAGQRQIGRIAGGHVGPAPKGAPRIVDLMAGTGEAWPALLRDLPQARIIAVDALPERLRAGEARARALPGLHVQPVVCDALATALPDGGADAVTCMFGTAMLPPDGLTQLAGEIARLLRPGGAYALIEVTDPGTPLLRPLYRAALRGLWPGLGVAPATCRTLDGLAGALRAAGLTAIPKRHGWGCATSLAGTKPIAPARGAA